MKNRFRFFTLSTVAVICSLFSGTSVQAMKPVSQLTPIREFTVASCNTLHEGPYQNWCQGVTVDTEKRAKAFEYSITKGDLLNADILVFQEWQYAGYDGPKLEQLEKIDETRKNFNAKRAQNGWNNLFKAKISKKQTEAFLDIIQNKLPKYMKVITIPIKVRLELKITMGVLIAYDTRKFSITKWPSKNNVIDLGMEKNHHGYFISLQYRTTNNTTKTVGIVGCHFVHGGNKLNDRKTAGEKQATVAIQKAPKTDSLIICGDFNWPDVKDARTFFGKRGFYDSDKNPSGVDTCLSPKGQMEKVDYIFHKGDIFPKKYTVCNDKKTLISHSKLGAKPDRNYFFSDHAILKTTFSVLEFDPIMFLTLPQEGRKFRDVSPAEFQRRFKMEEKDTDNDNLFNSLTKVQNDIKLLEFLQKEGHPVNTQKLSELKEKEKELIDKINRLYQ